MEIIGPRTRKAIAKAGVEPAEYLAAVGLLLQAGWELGWVPGRGWRARHRQRGEAWLSRQQFAELVRAPARWIENAHCVRQTQLEDDCPEWGFPEDS